MKLFSLTFAASCLIAGSAFAQNTATAPTKAVSPSPAATATVHSICKDGTTFDSASTRGACSGHGGVDKKAAAASPPAGNSPTVAKAPDPSASATTATPAAASGGGSGKVWVNTSSKVYHCSNDKYYGKTKKGEYMSEADAKAKGFHVSHGKACAT